MRVAFVFFALVKTMQPQELYKCDRPSRGTIWYHFQAIMVPYGTTFPQKNHKNNTP